MEGELESLEEVGADFTEPSPAASSLGSWADECELADTALTTAEAQMGRGCTEESLEGDTALAGDLLREDDCEWVAALGAAIELPPPWLTGAGGQLPGRQGAPKPIQGLLPARGDQRKPGPAQGRGQWPPRRERPPPKGPLPGRSLTAPATRGTRTKTRSRW